MICDTIDDFKRSILANTRLLGIDYGQAKLGIAVSDVEQNIATGKLVYTRRNISKDLGFLSALIRDEAISGIVIGLPIDMSGYEGESCVNVRQFGNKLLKKVSLPIFYQDERFSTAAADRVLKSTAMTRKKRNQLDDKLAASFILQTVLDSFVFIR